MTGNHYSWLQVQHCCQSIVSPIMEQGSIISHEILGMAKSSVTVHSTPFQIFTNTQLMLRPDVTTNLWPALIRPRILKRTCLSPQMVLVNTTTHFPSFVWTLNSGSADSDGSCWSSPVLRILYVFWNWRTAGGAYLWLFVARSHTLSAFSISIVSVHLVSSCHSFLTLCSLGFPQIPRRSPLHLLPPSGISGPWPQHISHKSGHHCPDLPEDTRALWSMQHGYRTSS